MEINTRLLDTRKALAANQSYAELWWDLKRLEEMREDLVALGGSANEVGQLQKAINQYYRMLGTLPLAEDIKQPDILPGLQNLLELE